MLFGLGGTRVVGGGGAGTRPDRFGFRVFRPGLGGNRGGGGGGGPGPGAGARLGKLPTPIDALNSAYMHPTASA